MGASLLAVAKSIYYDEVATFCNGLKSSGLFRDLKVAAWTCSLQEKTQV